MTSEADLEEQIEWFHQLASLSRDRLAREANAENHAALARFVEAYLPDHGSPEGQSPEEFVNTVLELRDNERQWNHALSAALIRADDLHKSNDGQSAALELESFAQSCPWTLFSEVAQDQAANYRSLM